MPSFNNIDNGESGLSVRNTLNEVIDFVNTGITSGFTFITEDTTVGSENVIISVTDGTNISTQTIIPSQTQLITTELSTGNSSQLSFESGNINFYVGDTGFTTFNQFLFDPYSSIQLKSNDGTDNTMIELTPMFITSTVTDGTNTSTETITPSTITSTLTDGIDSTTQSITLTSTQTIVTVGDLETRLFLDPSSEIDQTLIGDYNNNTGEFTEIRFSPDSNTGFAFQVGDVITSNLFTMTKDLFTMTLPAFDDDTDASTLSTGNLYQTTGLGASPLDVAGILMVKQ